MIHSGQSCEACKGGYYVVLDTLVKGTKRVQYLGCKRCGHRPEDNRRAFPANERSPVFKRTVST